MSSLGSVYGTHDRPVGGGQIFSQYSTVNAAVPCTWSPSSLALNDPAGTSMVAVAIAVALPFASPVGVAVPRSAGPTHTPVPAPPLASHWNDAQSLVRAHVVPVAFPSTPTVATSAA